MKKLTLNKLIIASLIVIISVPLIYFIIQLGSLWLYGMEKIMNDLENYYITSHPVEGEFSIEIDLHDLKSNEGKVLYREEGYSIYISEIEDKGDNYVVTFQSKGKADLTSAMVVSGIEYSKIGDDLLKEFQAEATATYHGETYPLEGHAVFDFSPREGDGFQFILFPVGKEMFVEVEENPMITVTVSNLYLTWWVKKR